VRKREGGGAEGPGDFPVVEGGLANGRIGQSGGR